MILSRISYRNILPCLMALFFRLGLFLVISTALSPQPMAEIGLIGFAGVNADGVNGTMGGLGGETVRPSSYSELADAASGDAKRIIKIDKTYTGKDIFVGSNKTIVGVGDEAKIQGFGFQIVGASNIIIRNLRFEGGGDDAINVTNMSHHVWIDHCSFRRYGDGLVDIKHGSSYITVSWSHFQNHHKTCLLGHSNNSKDEDVGKLKATYHHNWFDNTGSRHPRVRFGEAHVFNNYYLGNGYGVASTCDAKVLVEANFFKDVESPTHVGYASSWEGELVERGNIYESSGIPATMGQAFEAAPYYAYRPDTARQIPEIVMKGAGAGKVDPMPPPPTLRLIGVLSSDKRSGGKATLQILGPSERLLLVFHGNRFSLDGKSVHGNVLYPGGMNAYSRP